MPTNSSRDPRIDVMRGLSLLMIFADHIPNNGLSAITLHNFAFSDAAETFVLLAGFSATLAYGRVIDRDGWRSGIQRIALRCMRIYVAQVGLVLATLAIFEAWTYYFPTPPSLLKAIIEKPVSGLLHAAVLAALPSYLDILPLYLVLLGLFPVLFLALRRSPWLALGFSAALWLIAGKVPALNFPNWIDHQGWYFDPFAWQFLFTIGAVLACLVCRSGGNLPYNRWVALACAAYLAVGAIESIPWADWHLPDLRLFALAPLDKSHLAWPRIVSILAQVYLVMASTRLRFLAGRPAMRPLESCGRHSLEVFAVGCLCALIGRLAFRTFGSGLTVQILVNIAGIATMILAARALDRRAAARKAAPSPRLTTARLA